MVDNENMRLIAVTHGSSEYRKTVELRYEVLRKPLGLDFCKADLDAEKSDMHFAIFQNENLLACLVITPLGATSAKLRQMAVCPQNQGCGLGKRLVAGVEEQLRLKGLGHITLNAREHACGFYESMGYCKRGERFTEVGIDHFEMVKMLG